MKQHHARRSARGSCSMRSLTIGPRGAGLATARPADQRGYFGRAEPPQSRSVSGAYGSPGNRRRRAIIFRIVFRSHLRPGLIMISRRPALPLTGGCPCGAIRYEITSFPPLLYTGNCTNCQSASGSAFALNMPVLAKDFHILQGEPKGWRRLSPTGADVTSWFCGDCGGRIYGERVGRPQSINLRAGTLDDTAWHSRPKDGVASARLCSGRAYVHEKRAAMGAARDQCRMPRHRAGRFSAGGQGLARDVA